MTFRSPSTGVLWTVIACYILAVGMLVQLVLLPYVFPQLHAGNGLMLGGDWVRFHETALDVAGKIRQNGWSQWSLRPAGEGPAGILSILYVFFVQKPFVYLPLNAILHASAAIVLLKIARFFTSSDKIALLAILPFTFFPSSLLWLTQIHKDPFFILGNFLFLFAWILIGAGAMGKADLSKKTIKIAACAVSGLLLVWIMRPEAVQMLLASSGFPALLVLAVSALRWRKQLLPSRTFLHGLVLVLLVLGSTILIGRIRFSHGAVEAAQFFKVKLRWSNSWGLPAALDYRFYSLAQQRENMRRVYPNSTSGLDTGIGFTSTKDLLLYNLTIVT